MPDERVAAREFGNLEKIPDQSRKCVISLDIMAQGKYRGIRHLHLREFLATTPD